MHVDTCDDLMGWTGIVGAWGGEGTCVGFRHHYHWRTATYSSLLICLIVASAQTGQNCGHFSAPLAQRRALPLPTPLHDAHQLADRRKAAVVAVAARCLHLSTPSPASEGGGEHAGDPAESESDSEHLAASQCTSVVRESPVTLERRGVTLCCELRAAAAMEGEREEDEMLH